MKQLLYVFFVVLFFLPALACNSSVPQQVRGSGKIITESVKVSNFDQVSLDASGKVYIEQGSVESLTIEADDNILPLLDTRVTGNRLVLSVKEFQNIDPSQPIIYRLTVKNLNEIAIRGSGDFFVEPVESNDMKVAILGSGNIDIKSLAAKSITFDLRGSGDIAIDELEVKTIDASIPGSGTITLDGSAESQSIAINGSGDYLAGDLETARTEININGSGDLTVWVTDDLNVSVTGSGTVQYYGQPTVDQSGGGSGKLISRGKK